MDKFKQSVYTILLLFTCVVASPLIYKHIWDNSEIKKTSTVKKHVIYADVNTSQLIGSAAPTDAVTEEGTGAVEELPTEFTEPETTNPYVPSDASYFDNALFIGDSRTVGLRDYGTLNNADYYCEIGTATYKISYDDVKALFSEKSYGKIYIMLGINEIGNEYEDVMSSYQTLLDNIRYFQPGAIIYLVANLHVSTEAETDMISNERLNRLNEGIASLADDIKVFYLDMNPLFDDEDGNLAEDSSGDGIHLYAFYYPTWCEWFCMNTIPVPQLDETEPAPESVETDFVFAPAETDSVPEPTGADVVQ